MIRLRTYAAFSLLATTTAVYHAFSTRGQFYPAMAHLAASKPCLVLLLNAGLVAMCAAWQLVRRAFLGPLREAEAERLNEQAWREAVEVLFAVTIFRQEFSLAFLAMVAALLLVKALHWLAHKRVEYIETTPSVPVLSHARIVSFMAFLLVVDCIFLWNSLGSLIQKREASVAIFFSFEYMILATSTISTFVKYVFYVSDMLMEGQWEKKAVYTFYLELISDLVHLSLYMLFFIAIFLNYGVPLHLIRELYETFRNFRIRISDYVRYRKITSNMNERFPDATTDELTASDATCIICREEMTTAKKLLCGHLFHVHCLRSWLERQHTCPTCRAPIVPPDNGRAASSAQQHGAQPAAGTGTSTSGGAPSENVNMRQAKLEAAASAASVYGRSFAYPPASTLNRHSGPMHAAPSTSQSGEASSSTGHPLEPQPFYSHGPVGSTASSRDPENALQKAYEKAIRSQIEVLQIQLQMVQQRATTSAATNNSSVEHA
ncbi:ERAD-associated E3 ubiquitin-protein ligase HRD1-like isoform X1 [Lolium rigidum]|uniref:ERAD-associated E3 ubiquitin-protein ligase HRD1-like isoform X1 n=1 Tax=Lolium rigidum TaxID=89674 RepID=UPI001F5CBF19|nr:ERAD-associated E3 ubiquitin-protein ligase HRD1-like isoform X1 [Lolium rigidum]